MGAYSEGNPRRARLVLLCLIILAFGGGLLLLSEVLAQHCTTISCSSSSEPAITGAAARIGSFPSSACQTTPDIATCKVLLNGGGTGRVSLNVSLGSPGPETTQVEFLVYSSAADYVSFISIPSCAHTSAPSLEDQGCQLSGSAVTTFWFSFSVSKNYTDATARWPDSISVVMWTV